MKVKKNEVNCCKGMVWNEHRIMDGYLGKFSIHGYRL